MLEKRPLVWPVNWHDDILLLSETFSSYQTMLNDANSSQKERQSELYPARQVCYRLTLFNQSTLLTLFQT